MVRGVGADAAGFGVVGVVAAFGVSDEHPGTRSTETAEAVRTAARKANTLMAPQSLSDLTWPRMGESVEKESAKRKAAPKKKQITAKRPTRAAAHTLIGALAGS